MEPIIKHMDSKILISVEQLSRYYGHQLAVDHIDFTLSPGEVLGFLGPNGAGKSTTMQMITGNLAPSEGRIEINGIDMLDRPRQAKSDIGYLPEQPPVYRDLTVDEYLDYCARLHRVSTGKRGQAINHAKRRCGLLAVNRRLIGNLSKGYQQRVGIAQAILHNPAVVILDEPTVGLDPNQIREIRNLIRELGETHGIILSTHILPEVQATCTRVQIINEGRLVFSQSMQEIEKQLVSHVLVLETREPLSDEILENLPGADRSERLGPCRAKLHFRGENPAGGIAASIADHGLGLVELALDRQTLEQVFVELTCHDGPQATGDAA
ncbi:ABC-2 type transport system ATP-binding protein [Thiogranum longum]|uniref:ABC-2 type transport system ATP-binding protein n=1 Tax=Thiogranum longum TaxID=1537524 RepID=A0A4R1HCZ5_9GAMM|nr:ATP-binding cassette domain-containing protein [Thiogranum longum]TCK17109.1 ABC-2 type transport system ATP-binding protein [Thiogranum longum]